jgi:hypothetical protein
MTTMFNGLFLAPLTPANILYFKFISIDEMQVIVEWNIIYIAEAGFNGVWLTFHIYS